VEDDIFVRVDHEGNITGFAILNATKRMTKIREVKLSVKATFSQTQQSTS